ncbi:MAG: hypothetical protein JXQ75_21245 [Phycisphaerae bacterium]|nr:hypothetical protein [Phycisphaerae bacterium]
MDEICGLEVIEDGDARAAEEFLPIVYEELRRLATQKLSHEKPGQTLQATGLLGEANPGNQGAWFA